MARILICTHPITGHINPALVITRKLVERGHEVRFFTGSKFKAKVEAAGAQYAPMTYAYDYDDADLDKAFPGRTQLQGLNQIKFDFKKVFIEQIANQVADLRDLFKTWQPDVVLSDPAFGGARILYVLGEIKAWAVFNITVLGLPSADLPPFGLGILPDYSALGKLKNKAMAFMATNLVFRDVNASLRDQLKQVGLPAEPFAPMFSPMLYLQPSVPAFEYPRSDLPASVHFIGPLLPDLKTGVDLPAWWDELTNTSKPVVLVTQGTIATDATELIQPTIEALAGQDVLVVATVDPDQLKGQLPANVRAHKFIPFDVLMPHVDVLVTNGGYGGVTLALAQGVPVICAGTTEDKPEVGNRISYAGVGINLKTNRPTSDQVRATVQSVLADASYKAKAVQMKTALGKHDAATEAAMLIEKLLTTRQPIPRSAEAPVWVFANA